MDSHDVIIRPLHTEKSVGDIQAQNTYHFDVAPRASKSQIRHAIEELWPSVKVLDVRTMRVRGKRRRVRYDVGMTRERKKAVVKLRDGDQINLGY